MAGGGRGEDPQKRLRLCVLQPTPPAGRGPGPGCSHGGCRLRGEPSREPQRPPNRARTQQGSPGPCRGHRPQHRLLMWGEEGTLPGALSPARAGGTGPWGVQGPLPAGWGVRYLLLDGALGLLLRARWHCPALRPRGRGGHVRGAQGKDLPGGAGPNLASGLLEGGFTLPVGGEGRGTPRCSAGGGGEGPMAGAGAALGSVVGGNWGSLGRELGAGRAGVWAAGGSWWPPGDSVKLLL